jgi:hypothetical protein
MQCHYKTDIGQTYYFFRYQAYLDDTRESINQPVDILSLIPSSISNLIVFEETGFNCPISGITPRYLEIFDIRQNRYIIQCPLPWLELLPGLFQELNNNSEILGFVAYGEKVKYRNLIRLSNLNG